MPAHIDRGGRAHEWATAAELNARAGNREQEALCRARVLKYTAKLSAIARLRIEIGAKKTAERIAGEVGEKSILSATIVGEASKRPGSPDVDLNLSLDGGKSAGYSLKSQKTATGVNVRNPTINSLLEGLTLVNFEDGLSESDRQAYYEAAERYQQYKLRSRDVAALLSPHLVMRLQKAYAANPREFVTALLREGRFKANILLTVVRANGSFLGFGTNSPGLVKEIERDPSGLTFEPKGIAVRVLRRGELLCKLDMIMLSSSSGRGKRMRCVIRRPFDLEPSP